MRILIVALALLLTSCSSTPETRAEDRALVGSLVRIASTAAGSAQAGALLEKAIAEPGSLTEEELGQLALEFARLAARYGAEIPGAAPAPEPTGE